MIKSGEVVRTPPSPTPTDIRSYLDAMFDGCTNPNLIGNGLLADIIRTIPEEIAEM